MIQLKILDENSLNFLNNITSFFLSAIIMAKTYFLEQMTLHLRTKSLLK